MRIKYLLLDKNSLDKNLIVALGFYILLIKFLFTEFKLNFIQNMFCLLNNLWILFGINKYKNRILWIDLSVVFE